MSQSKFLFPQSSVKSDYFSSLGADGVVLWSVLNIGARASFRLAVEKVTPLRPQGIWLCTDMDIEIIGGNGKASSQQYLIFDDAPHELSFVCETSDGLLHLYNMWEVNGMRRSQMRMSGMEIEDIPGGYRYRCTDTGPEPDFERFVFTLVRLDGPMFIV